MIPAFFLFAATIVGAPEVPLQGPISILKPLDPLLKLLNPIPEILRCGIRLSLGAAVVIIRGIVIDATHLALLP